MLKTFDIEALIVQLLKSDVYKLTMVNMNRTRLFETGRDIRGGEIQTFSKSGSTVYAKRTIVEKQELGLPTNIVTGYMTGKMHESFFAKVTKAFIEIKADKGRFDDFKDNIASNHDLILGLTEEDEKKIIVMLDRDLGDLILENITEEHLVDTDNLKYV